jgi:fructosamine-3-kinase
LTSSLNARGLAAIATAISEQSGIRFAPESSEAVGGGSIHRAWKLSDGLRHYFVKTNEPSAAPMFATEAHGLRVLSAAGAVRTPTVIACGQNEDAAFLILEWIDLAPLDQRCGADLGAALARQHRLSGDAFGWTEDNYIGVTPQQNKPHPGWPHFFGENRLRPQLQLAQRNGMDKALVAKGCAAIERCGGLFIDYRPAPSLLHGDLWSGNAAQSSDGRAVIYDPACYYGDRETDIAMAELFGGFPASFYAAYRTAWPLHSGYEARKPLYNLYHILNHFNLFGAAYGGQAQRMIEGLLNRLRR